MLPVNSFQQLQWPSVAIDFDLAYLVIYLIFVLFYFESLGGVLVNMKYSSVLYRKVGQLQITDQPYFDS